MFIKRRRSQSIIEYVMLFALIISAIIIMQVYVKRAYQGKLKQEADQLGSQYSPGHTTSKSETDISSMRRIWSENPGVTATKTNTETKTEYRERTDSLTVE